MNYRHLIIGLMAILWGCGVHWADDFGWESTKEPSTTTRYDKIKLCFYKNDKQSELVCYRCTYDNLEAKYSECYKFYMEKEN